jgi:predicted site-specific integrase-resolvase
MVTLPTFLPLPEAARKYGVSEARLKTMIDNGKIRAAMIQGTIVISESDAAQSTGKPLRKEDLPEWKQFSHLYNHGIGIREASRKYGVHPATLSVWVKKDVIKILRVEPNKTLLNEQDVAYACFIYKQRGKQGRKIFDDDGLPYKPKTGPLAL